MRAQIQLPPKLIPVFQGKARYRCSWGGRGSGKTRGFALMTAVDGYRFGRAGISGNILCAREHLVNLDESSMEEVKGAIRSTPWLDAYYEIGEKYIRSKDGRIKYLFTGLRHNLGGIKSKARILRCWVDEAEPVGEKAWSTLLPTLRSEGDGWETEIWATWNPEFESSATHQRFRKDPPQNWKGVELNWRDNPWFPAALEQERLEDLKKRPDTYEHIWEGGFLEITDAQVFHGLFEMDEFEPQDDWEGPYHGLDFGYANDPTAAIQSYIHNNVLYIRREAGKKKLELDEMPNYLTRTIPRISMYVLRCDSARPESISYLRNHGFPRAMPAKKGKGSVEDGVAYIKSFDRVVIHPDCPETYKEFRLYSYKIDRESGDILPVLIDSNNHWIDALRYALEPRTRMRRGPRLRSL